jgi:hypothetical protein
MKRILGALDSSPTSPAVLAASDRPLEEVLIRDADTDLERRTRDLPPRRIEKRLSVFAVPWDSQGAR